MESKRLAWPCQTIWQFAIAMTLLAVGLPINSALLFASSASTSSATHQGASAEGLSDEELFALAAAFYTDQNWSEAADNFQQLIDAHPDSELIVKAQFYLGESLIQSRQHEKALVVFKNCLENHKDNPFATRATFRTAECYYLNNEFEEARTRFMVFMEANSPDPLAEFALPYLGELHLRFGDIEKSRIAYQKALTRFPTSQLSNKCRLGLGQSLSRLGQRSEAERFFRFVAGQNNDPLADDAQLLIGKMYAEQGDWEKAQTEFESLVRTFPDSESLVEAKYLAAKRDLTDGNWQACWDSLEPLLDKPMDDAMFCRVALDAAIVATRIDKLDRAKQLTRRVKEKNPTGSTREFLSVIEIDLAHRKKDIRALQSLVTEFEQQFGKSSHITRCVEPLARLHYDRSEFAEAAVRYQQLIELVSVDPKLAGNLPAWRYLLGLSRIGTREYRLALSYLQSIREFEGNVTFEAATSFAVATALTGDQRWAEAIPHYQRYLDLTPTGEDSVRCHADLAVAQVKCNKLSRAIRTIDSVARQKSSDLSVLGACEIIAEAALKSNDSQTAQRFYQILAKSGHKEYESRGVNGLVWSGDKSMLTPEKLREVIGDGIDADLAFEAIVGQVQQLQARNEHPQTVAILSDLIESNPNSPLIDEAKFRLAVSLQRIGGLENSQKAKGLLERFLKNQPTHTLADLARYELAWAKHDSNDLAGAEKQFSEIADANPASEYRLDACFRAATLSRQLGDDMTARLRFKQLLGWDAKHSLAAYAHYTLGEMDCQHEAWAESIAHFQKVIDSNTDETLKNPSRYWLAEAFYQSGNIRASENQFRAIQDTAFEKPEIKSVIWLRLAQCAASRKDWVAVDSIVETCRKLSIQKDSEFQLDYLQGRVMMSRAKFNEAREMFSRVLRSETAKGTRTAAMSQWMIGESWFHQEDYRQSLRAYLLVDSLYDYAQWRSLALLQAAKCHLHLGDPLTARKTCERMLNTFPDSGQASEARQLLVDIAAVTSNKPNTKSATFSK